MGGIWQTILFGVISIILEVWCAGLAQTFGDGNVVALPWTVPAATYDNLIRVAISAFTIITVSISICDNFTQITRNILTTIIYILLGVSGISGVVLSYYYLWSLANSDGNEDTQVTLELFAMVGAGICVVKVLMFIAEMAFAAYAIKGPATIIYYAAYPQGQKVNQMQAATQNIQFMQKVPQRMDNIIYPALNEEPKYYMLPQFN